MSNPSDGRFIPFFKPSFDEREEEAVIRVLRSGWLTTGKEALEFEAEFARFTGASEALAVNSATSGLLLAMQALGIGKGDKILTSPYTFVSTATSAIHLGAEVAYADISKKDYGIDPEAVDRALERDPSIKAVVPIHIAGLPCDMRSIMDIARARGAFVIEDAAHSFPSRTEMGFAGTIGDAGVFSFYATKTITTGEGGMITARDPEVARRIRTLRSHGIDRTIWDRYTSKEASWKYDVVTEGWKCNLPDILACIGRVQLAKADEFFEKRARAARALYALLSGLDYLELPPDGPGNAWHLFIVRIKESALDCGRDQFASELQDRGIGISMHFIPHFEMTWCKNRYGLSRNDFPEAARKYDESITLPLWPDMTMDDVERVANAVKAVGTKHGRKAR